MPIGVPFACRLTAGEPFENSTRRNLDLADMLMLHWPDESRRVTLGLSSHSRERRWQVWSEPNVERLEDLIRHDLGFDGYDVDRTRLSTVGIAWTDEFKWSLYIRERSEGNNVA